MVYIQIAFESVGRENIADMNPAQTEHSAFAEFRESADPLEGFCLPRLCVSNLWLLMYYYSNSTQLDSAGLLDRPLVV